MVWSECAKNRTKASNSLYLRLKKAYNATLRLLSLDTYSSRASESVARIDKL